MDYILMGKCLKEARERKGLSQQQTALMADISASFYGHIERGTRKASVETLAVLCELLEVSMDEASGLKIRRPQAALADARALLALALELSAPQECPSSTPCTSLR